MNAFGLQFTSYLLIFNHLNNNNTHDITIIKFLSWEVREREREHGDEKRFYDNLILDCLIKMNHSNGPNGWTAGVTMFLLLVWLGNDAQMRYAEVGSLDIELPSGINSPSF